MYWYTNLQNLWIMTRSVLVVLMTITIAIYCLAIPGQSNGARFWSQFCFYFLSVKSEGLEIDTPGMYLSVDIFWWFAPLPRFPRVSALRRGFRAGRSSTPVWAVAWIGSRKVVCHCLGLGPVLGSGDFGGEFFASPLTFHPRFCMLAGGHSTWPER